MLIAIVEATCGHPVTHQGEHIAVGRVVHCPYCNGDTCVTAVVCVHDLTPADKAARRTPRVELSYFAWRWWDHGGTVH